jgi:hypothetical protein
MTKSVALLINASSLAVAARLPLAAFATIVKAVSVN